MTRLYARYFGNDVLFGLTFVTGEGEKPKVSLIELGAEYMAFIIDDLLFLPIKGFWGILKRIQQMADQELGDRESLQKKLLELQLQYEMNEISEEEYQKMEADILNRLSQIRPGRYAST